MKIEKMANGKYKVYLDNEIITTTEEVIINTNLLYKENVTDEIKKEILNQTSFYEVYNKVVKFILKKIRSKEEIKNYLDKFELDAISKNKMLSKLESANLINDKQFCKCYINDKIYINKYGLNRIKTELKENKIPEEIIEEELKNVDDDVINKNLEKLIIKKIKSNSRLSTSLFKQKIIFDLINKGYYKDDILLVLDRFNINDDHILEKEYNKIYNKLSKKYTGNELISNVKLKLISKGFSSFDISRLIEKSEE